jgi:hypothetical protein
MSVRQQQIASLLAILALAAGLRFYKIGAWSFDVDEIGTLIEDRIAFSGEQYPEEPEYPQQYGRLPKILPLGYAIQHVGYLIFGRSEETSRLLPAILGTATAAAAYLLLRAASGQATALITALLVAMWPAHLLFSQDNRFYSAATLFAFLCMSVGALVQETSRRIIPLAIVVLGIAALLSHTIAGGAYALALAGIFVRSLVTRRAVSPFSAGVLSAGIAVLGLILIFYVLPLARNWNATADWGDSPAAALVGTVNRIGWPVVLLALLGAVTTLADSKPANWYWLGCFLALWIVVCLAPLRMVYSARYSLPLALPVFVLAGHAIATIYTLLCTRSRLAAVAWVAASLSLDVPSLLSYYADGSRPDFRGGIQYVVAHWQPGDCVCYLGGRKHALDYYASANVPNYSLINDPVTKLKELTRTNSRVWVVSPNYRSGPTRDVDRWLYSRFSRETHLEKRRYDYYSYIVDVFLYDGAGPKGSFK